MQNALLANDSGGKQITNARHQDKLSDIGAHVAKAVHELNVPLSLVIGSLQTLEQYTTASARYIRASQQQSREDDTLSRLRRELSLDYLIGHAPALLEICREGTRRLTHVIRQLKVYSRNAVEQRLLAPLDVCKVLQDAISLARCGRDMVPEVRCGFFELPPVIGSADSLWQAFLNVTDNAFDAVATVAEPTVWVSANVVRAEAPTARSTACAEIRIRDNGPGVLDADRQRIFEPFCTTKLSRSGMGLGLAITKEIIESHGGSIMLAPSASSGAEFVIRLPIETDIAPL